MGRCDGHGLEEVLKILKNECQLMERCDGHGGGARGGERCDGYQGDVWRYGKMRQLTGSVTVIGEM